MPRFKELLTTYRPLDQVLFWSILLVFIFFRLFNIQESLQFWGDIGRDLYVLELSSQTHKPPLLGPTVSFLPINQSPLYYYFYYPLFLLSNASPYTTILTGICIYGIAWFFLSKIRKKAMISRSSFFVIGLFVAIHPEFIRQLRPPWNPSIAFPFFLGAIISVFYLREHYSRKVSWLFSFFLAISIGLTYSLVPAVIVLIGTYCLKYFSDIRKILFFLGQLVCSFTIVFLPIILFELKSHFLLSRNLFHASVQANDTSLSFIEKMNSFMSFVSGTHHHPTTLFASYFIFIMLAINLLLIWFQNKTEIEKNSYDSNFLYFLSLLCITVGLTLLSPFALHSHYIFGVAGMLVLCIAHLRRPLMIFTVLILSLWWLHPFQIQAYFGPTKRTVVELEQCAQLICDREKQPLLVTVQAWHSSHFAADHLFFLNKAGCVARDISQQPNFSNRMLVIEDNSEYIHNTSDFHEVSTFGESKEVDSYFCSPSKTIEVHVLEKN